MFGAERLTGALFDRLTHHVHILSMNGDSYRLTESARRRKPGVTDVDDLFVVPTIGFKLLFAFVIVRLDRRDLVWNNVTTSPTAEGIAHAS